MAVQDSNPKPQSDASSVKIMPDNNEMGQVVVSSSNISRTVYKAKVVSTEIVALAVKKISFKVEDEFKFFAWQYIWVEIPELKIKDEKGNRRAFSIINTINEDNIVEIVARFSDSGYKQSLFSLDIGDEVNIYGPFGSSFVIDDKTPENIVMIAGGVGIAAFLPMINTIKNNKLKNKSHLVYLNKDKQSTPFLDDLKSLKKSMDFFDYSVKYDNLKVADVNTINNNLKNNAQWWIVGPQGMVDFAYKILESIGVSRADMIFENFYPINDHDLTAEDVAKNLANDNVFAQALENSTNHTVITNSEGVVLYANRAAQKTTGFSEQEIIGNTPRLWGGLMSPEFYKDLWQRKSSGLPFEGEIINRRKNGEVYYAMAHIAPILDKQKRVVGFIGTEEDLTELRLQQEKTKNSEERLKFAVEGSRDGLWDWNIATGDVYLSPQWKAMLGYEAKDLKGRFEEWENLLHPDDKKKSMNALNAHLECKTPYFETEYRIRCKNGEYKWVLSRGMVTSRSHKFEPLRAVGTHTDITEARIREKELEKLNKFMVGRELKMIELKKDIKRLKEQKLSLSSDSEELKRDTHD
jgi:PAS domain S-box-containing protein